ncbi:hypothetical protein V2J56_14500 [Georgenia sp. MJ206]|uniref:hypothetical protein n=1 Tax=Georgenia wangjunii TaxID=3117730 RepID=UPI002F265ABC
MIDVRSPEVGAAGEFTVYLGAKGGADDLPVFVDEADAAGWQDGTRVEMVLESVEATIKERRPTAG